MNKKIIGLACFALCIFFLATLRNLSCPAKAQNGNDQSPRFQITSTLDLTQDNRPMIELCRPATGGGRGPCSMAKL